MGLLGEMTVRLGVDVSQFNSGLSSATSSLASFASTPIGAVVTGLTVAAGAAAALGAASVQAASDFQTSNMKIQAYAGLTSQQTQQMSQDILNMSTQVAQTPKAISDAMYPLISSGYTAAQSLQMVSLAAKTAAASGANTAQVADLLSTELKTFGFSADKSTAVMDVLNKTVADSKTTFPELSAVLGKLSLAASGAHVPFLDMNAALATLTTHGFPSVAQASNSLGNLFTQIGVKTDALEKHAKALGISFDGTKFAAMSFGDKIQYLNQVTGGNQAELLKMLNGNTLALKAFNALKTGAGDYTKTLGDLNHAQGTTAQVWAAASQTYAVQSQKMGAAFDVLKISIGNALLPVISNLMARITPMITQFADWIVKSNVLQNTIQFLSTWINNLIVFLTPLAQMIGGLVSWIGSLIGGMNGAGGATSIFTTIIQYIGSYLQSVFMPLWYQLVDVFNNQILPAWYGLQAAIKPIMPVLIGVAQVVGLVLYSLVASIVSTVSGVIGALAGFLGGLARVIGGIVQFFSGAIQVMSGWIAFFTDLFSGKFDKLGGDLQTILGGYVDMFRGMWNAIEGIFEASVNTLIGLINGFIQGAVGALNVVITAAGGAALSVGTIPLMQSTASTGGFAMPGFSSHPTKSTDAQPPAWLTNFANSLPSNYNPDAAGGMPQTNPMAQKGMPASPAFGSNLNSMNYGSPGSTGGNSAPSAGISGGNSGGNQNLSQILASPNMGGGSSNPTAQAVRGTGATSAAQRAAHHQQVLAAAAKRHQEVLARQAARHQQAVQHHQEVLAAAAARHQQVLQHHQAVLAAAAARHAQAQQHHQEALAAAAARKAQSTKNHQDALAAAAARHQAVLAAATARQAQAQAHHQAMLDAAAQRHAQHMAQLQAIHTTLKQTKAATSTTGVATSSNVTPLYSGSSATAGSSYSGAATSGAASSSVSGQPLTIIVELEGQQLVQYIGDTTAKTVRLRTGMRAG